MAKEKLIESEGLVVDVLPNTQFKVKLDNGHIVSCYLSGKMKINFVKVLLNDRVLVEMSPYDLSKGRIIYRFK